MLALLFLLTRGVRCAVPALGITAFCFLVIDNPGDIPRRVFDRLPAVSDVLRGPYFLLGFPLAAALLTGLGIHGFLQRPARPLPVFLIPAAIAAALGWCLRQFVVWGHAAGFGFATSWFTFLEVGVSVSVVAAVLWLYRARRNPILLTVLVLLAWTDYKVYGTNRRFNAQKGDVDRFFADDRRTGGPDVLGLDPAVYQQMLDHPTYRVLLDLAPASEDLRYYQLTTPSGFDPFLPAQFIREVALVGKFVTNRTFRVDVTSESAYQHFGARYVITIPDSPVYTTLGDDPRFRLLQPATSFYRVFEYRDPRPVYRFGGPIQYLPWRPEFRHF